MKPGDPGLDTWASLDAARHGKASDVGTGLLYDPGTKLYIFGTGNRQLGRPKRNRDAVFSNF